MGRGQGAGKGAGKGETQTASPRSQTGVRASQTAEVVSEDLKAVLALSQGRQQRKYRNVPTEVDGIHFDSKREAERYGYLRMLEQAGAIHDLFIHEAFPLVVHGQDCGSYISDFTYMTETGERVVEDVKSAATRKLPTYRLKRKMLWALYGLRITEV